MTGLGSMVISAATSLPRVSPSGPRVDAVAFRPLQVGLHFHLYTALASVWLDGAGSRVGSGSCRHAAPTTGERPGLRVPRGVTQGPREWDGPRVAALQAATLLCWFLTLAAVRITGECSKTDAQHLYLITI